MAEGEDNADFSAAELATIGGKRSFNRAISLAFSQAANDDSLERGTGEESRRVPELPEGVTDEDESDGDQDESDDDDEDDDDDDDDDDDENSGDEKDDVDDIDDLENCENVGEDGSSFSKHQGISCIASSSDAPPAQSNKKKRKHRKNKLLLKKQFLGTFENLFEAHCVSTGSEVEPKDMNVVCSVPTLMELCLQKGLKKTGISDGTKKTQIAPGIKFLLKVHKKQQRLEQVHLKWLLEALKQAEHQLKSNVCHFITQNGRKVEYFIRIGGAVNLTDCYSRQSFSRQPNTEMRSTEVIPIGVEGFENSDWAVAALAHCINLLLPSYKHDKDSKEAKMGLLKVRRLLSNHVSTLVSHCFDVALGYVWWSRGKIDQAQKTLLEIVSHIPSDYEARLLPDKKQTNMFSCQKSLYLNELGRMLSQFDQPDSSVLYYRQAVDMFEETSVDLLDHQVMQSFVLCAAAYDQGPMDYSHAVKAASFWEIVTTNPRCPVEFIQASIDSFLHCHTGFVVADKSEQGQLDNANMRNETWLLEADSRIEKIAARAPQVNLHQSLIMSMFGEERRAKAAYSRYVEQFANSNEYYQSEHIVVGRVACSGFEEVKPHPWWTLFKWMSTKAALAGSFIHRPIPGIPLLWRRSIRHAAYCSEPSNDITEVKGRTLNLHITHDGYLSGTMLQNIPPFKSVLLDPHTGSICIPDQHRQCEALEWDNYTFGRKHYTDFCVDAFLPFPILLFQNSCEDITVTLLNVSTTANLRKEKILPQLSGSYPKHANVSSTVVYSKGRDTVKINLRELVMKARKAAILQQIKERCVSKVDQTIIKDCNTLLDYCITRGLQIDYAFVERVIMIDKDEALMELVRQKMSAGRSTKDAKCGPRKKKGRSIDLPPRQALSLQDVLYVGRSTVILCLFTASTGSFVKMEQDTFVFLDCSSLEAIRNPVIHCAILHDSVWMLPIQKTCWKSKDFKQDVFYAYTDTIQLIGKLGVRKRTLMVFDEFGDITLQRHFPERWIRTWQGPYTGCFGHHIIGYLGGEDRPKIRVWNTRGNTKITKATRRVEHLIVAQDMAFVPRAPNIVVLDSITLEPLQVQTRTQGCAPVTDTNGILVRNEWRFMSVLATTACSKVSPSDGNKKIVYTRVTLGVANHVLILEKQNKASSDSGTNPYPVDVVADILIPGIPREAYFISKRAGLVVAASLYENIDKDPYYRENLYWFSVSGVIQGIHPMLGKSPHQFTAVPLQTKDDTAPGEDASREKCWHLFFDDGLSALCCIKLESDDVF